MAECACGEEQADKLEKKTLIALLAINAFMFVFELVLGWMAQSTGLIADSLDMFADAAVYSISLYVVGKGVLHQVKAARLSGLVEVTLGSGALFEVIRRSVFGSEPESSLMLSVGAVALLANVICLALIYKHKEGGVHMRASWIFSANDVIANLGVILSGVLVAAMGSRLPDLIVGAIISIIVIRAGLRILKVAKETLESAT